MTKRHILLFYTTSLWLVNVVHTHTVQYLLSTGKVDPLARDHEGKTPMMTCDDPGLRQAFSMKLIQ